MKSIYLLLFLTLCFFGKLSAQKRIISFKNDYKTYPDTIQSKYDYDETWNRLIAMLREGNFAARLIDRPTGNFCFMLDDAKMCSEKSKEAIDTTAWAVSEKVYYVGRNQYFYPKSASIVWYAHINNNPVKLIIDSIKFSDQFKVYTHDMLFNEDTYKEFELKLVTTGKIEKLIKNYIQ